MLLNILRKRILIILICLGAVLCGVIYIKYFSKSLTRKNSFLSRVERNLSGSEKDIYANKLLEAQKLLSDYREKITDNKDYAKVYLYIAQQYWGLGELKKSREFLESAEAMEEENYNIQVAIYEVALEQGDYEGAKFAVLRALQLNPKDIDLYQKQAFLYAEKFGLGKEKVMAVYNEGLKQTGRPERLLVLYSRYLETQKDFHGALNLLREAGDKNMQNNFYKSDLERLEKNAF